MKNIKYYFPPLPMLIEINSPIVDDCSKDRNWIAELKMNGSNCLITKNDNKFYFYDRHAKFLINYTKNIIKPVIDELESLNIPDMSIINAELLNDKTKKTKHKLFCHTILMWSSVLYNNVTFGEQRKQLEDIFKGKRFNHLLVAHQFTQLNFRELFYKSIKEGFFDDPDIIEGLVLKDLRGKISLNTYKSQIVSWMLKIRRGDKRYAF